LQKQVTERQNIYGISLYITKQEVGPCNKRQKKNFQNQNQFFFRGDKLLNAQREVWQKEKKSHFRTHRKLVKEFFFFFFFLGTRLASYLVFCTIFYLHGSSKLVNFVQFFCVFLSPPSQLLLFFSCLLVVALQYSVFLLFSAVDARSM